MFVKLSINAAKIYFFCHCTIGLLNFLILTQNF